MTPAVEAEALTKRYRGRTTPAVDGVSFTIPEGTIVGLLGPNGAGKTTLVKLLCGVIPPSAGSVKIFGLDPIRHPVEVKSSVGVVHQRATFDLFLSAEDNLAVAAAFRGLRWQDIKPRVDDLLDGFQLMAKRAVPTWTLSGGEMRRLQVVRALLRVPRLLILDEPSAGLDVTSRRRVWEILQSLRQKSNTTIFWTSHYVEELERNCDQVMIIKQGKLIRMGHPNDLISEYGRQRVVFHFPSAVDGHALAALRQVSTLDVITTGTRVEVAGEDAPARVPELIATFALAGHSPNQIQVLPASLEDAFVALIGGGSS